MFRARPIILVLLTALAFVISTPSYAASNAENVASLQKLFDGMMERQRQKAEFHGAKIEQKGEVMIEPAANYYAVTIPPITISYIDGSYTEIGMIAINVMPGSAPGQWKMSAALPTPLIAYGKDNRPIMRLDFGSQNFAGIWDEDFENFTKIKAEYRDIKVQDETQDFQVTIPTSQITLNLEKDVERRWSGPGSFTISGLEMTNGHHAKAHIDNIVIGMDISQYSVEEMDAYREKMAAISESTLWDAQAPSWNHILGVYNLITEFVSTVWDGYNIDIKMDGITVDADAKQGSPDKSRMTIGKAGFGFGLSGLRKNNVRFDLRAHYNDFNVTPPPADIDQDATPDSTNINVGILNMPYKELVELGQTTLKMIADSPDSMELATMNAIATAPAILTKAGTNLKVQDISANNKDYNLVLKGIVNADIEAMLNVTGNANLTVSGMQKMIDMDNLKQLKPTLTILQAMSQKQTGANGETVNVFDVSVGKDGKVMMNGNDLSPLFEAMHDAKKNEKEELPPPAAQKSK